FDCAVGGRRPRAWPARTADERQAGARVPENGDHTAQTRVLPQKRRALQRERGAHGILDDSDRRRRGLPRRHEYARRSDVPRAAVCPQRAVQETARQQRLETDALRSALTKPRLSAGRTRRRPPLVAVRFFLEV